ARGRAARDPAGVSAPVWAAARLPAEPAAAAAAAAKADLDELNAGSRAERLAALEAAVEALLAAIAAVDVDLGKTLVRAPFAGRVSDRLVDEGEVLAPGAPLLELREEAPASSDGTSAAGGLEVRVGVLPRLAATLREGQSLPIRYRGHRASAEVVAVRSDRSVRTRTVSVLLRALVTEAGGATAAAPRLRDGELVEVEFEHRVETAGFWLPHAALTEGARGLWRCFVLEPDPTGGTFRVVGRTVEVVHFDEERAYVRGALEDSDLVVSGGTHRLVPGISARIAAESAR
ncbi:MAG: HlyD family efflux transporter periplasmic adaptor subunit, partial [Planctomycetota bacterium]